MSEHRVDLVIEQLDGIVSILVNGVQVDCAPVASDELAIKARAIGRTIALLNSGDPDEVGPEIVELGGDL